MSVRKLPACLALLLLSGCSSQPSYAPERLSGSTRSELRGDADDLANAVEAGATKARMAILHDDRGHPVRTFRFVTELDQLAVLRVEHTDPGPILLDARVGRFGDKEREAELIRWVATRLEELEGVDVRRIEWLPSDVTP